MHLFNSHSHSHAHSHAHSYDEDEDGLAGEEEDLTGAAVAGGADFAFASAAGEVP